MMRVIEIRTPEEQERWGVGGLHAPDTHVIVHGDGEEPVARCSLWWSRAPTLPGHRVGLVGHYAARDLEAARRLLAHACERLAVHACTLAVGPIDGSTWRRYRLIVERGTEPAFFLEPDNPDDWPAQFGASGFTPLAYYRSAINTDLRQVDSRLAEVSARLAREGGRIRPLDPDRFDDEVRRLYAVAAASFHQNYLYTPLSEEEFVALYRPLQPHVRPELVLVAEDGSRPIGFLFALPDLREARRTGRIDTVILKTVAVVPERAGQGLGTLLIGCCQEIAQTLGYTRAIHALMREASPSIRISHHSARPMRRYALFGRRLRP